MNIVHIPCVASCLMTWNQGAAEHVAPTSGNVPRCKTSKIDASRAHTHHLHLSRAPGLQPAQSCISPTVSHHFSADSIIYFDTRDKRSRAIAATPLACLVYCAYAPTPESPPPT